MNDSHATVVTKYFAKIVFTVIYNIIVIKYSHHIEPMTPVSHSGVEKNNDDGKRHYFSSNRYDAAAEIVPLEKLEVNLTQNGLPQFQDLYRLPLLPQCRVTAFVHSKFQYGMNICIQAHKYFPKGSQ